MNDRTFRKYSQLIGMVISFFITYKIVKLLEIDQKHISINCRCQYIFIISNNFSNVQFFIINIANCKASVASK